MTRTALPALLLLLAMPGSCRGPAPVGAEEVRELLEAQAREWNSGSIPGFVGFYSEDLTFLGADGPLRGGEDLTRRYRTLYPDERARGRLAFEVLECRPLGAGAALVLGRYRLDRAEPASGWFTLVLERRPDGLRITHDHTTAARPDSAP